MIDPDDPAWNGSATEMAVRGLQRAAQDKLNAAKAEAVLAFADHTCDIRVKDQARRFLTFMGWSETPGQAERGKP